jgi:phage baseplate assembly protein W
MALGTERWGTDLRLLQDLAHQNSRDRGSDLSTRSRTESSGKDLEPLKGVENLKQALLLRFLTPVGELAPLGHPDYGSRLFDLLGSPNNETNRNRAKMYVLQALKDEPRIKKVLAVSVMQNRSERTRLDIEVSLTPIDSDTTLNFVFPFFLEGGATP